MTLESQEKLQVSFSIHCSDTLLVGRHLNNFVNKTLCMSSYVFLGLCIYCLYCLMRLYLIEYRQ